MRKLVIALAVVGLAAVFAAGFAAQRLTSRADASYRGSVPPAGISLPQFTLRDESGRVVRSSALRRKAVLVTFLESQCTEACPLIARQVRDGLALLDDEDRARVVALAISTHPGDDTSANVRAFLRRHGVEGELRYLLGSEEELRPVWNAFAVLPAADTGDADMHSAPVRIYGVDGEWMSTLHAGVDLTAQNLSHDLELALG